MFEEGYISPSKTMAVVGVQHGAPRQQYNPHRSSPSPNLTSPSGQQLQHPNYTSATAPSSQQLQNSTPSINGMNGTLSTMNSRHTVSNDPVQHMNGTEAGSAYAQANSGRIHAMAQNGSTPSITRPTTSAGGAAESSQDDSEPDRIRRRPVPLLRRSKSDFGPGGENIINTDMEEDIQDWGERHGFGTNYASEEYVSQLANVSRSFLQ